MQLSDYDLIGYKIISPFHLAAFTAFASRFKPDRQSLNVLVVTSKGPWQEKILQDTPATSSRLKLTFLDGDDFKITESRAWPLLLLLKPIAVLFARTTGRDQIPVCSPTMTCLRFSAASIANTFSLKPVIIDEGIGSFNSALLLRQEADKLASNQIIRAVLWRIFQLLWANLTLFGGSRVSLFSFKHGIPKIDEIVAKSYQETFRTGYLERNEPTPLEPNTILILTHPIAETGGCTETDMVDQITAWVEYAKSLGARPVLKAHPAEAVSKYDAVGLERINYSGPVEELFAGASKNIREVWGSNSTSLITGRVLFGLETKRMELPWRQASVHLFQGQALTLFQTYTDPISLGQNLKLTQDKGSPEGDLNPARLTTKNRYQN